MQTEFIYHTDPGHGWLEVERTHVEQLGVAISDYSYQKGSKLYLEEDCDMTAFVDVFEARFGHKPTFVEKYVNETPIRDYESYATNS